MEAGTGLAPSSHFENSQLESCPHLAADEGGGLDSLASTNGPVDEYSQRVTDDEGKFALRDDGKRERNESTENLCAFCHEGEDDEDPEDDPIVPAAIIRSKQVYAHLNCLMWCPELTQAEDDSWQNVGAALRRCHRLKCAVCGEGDAPLGCLRKACRKNWHAPCAMEPSTGLVIYEEEFCVACPVCDEVMKRRAKKKALLAEQKKKAKQAAAAAAAAALPARTSATPKLKKVDGNSSLPLAGTPSTGKAQGKAAKSKVPAAKAKSVPMQKDSKYAVSASVPPRQETLSVMESKSTAHSSSMQVQIPGLSQAAREAAEEKIAAVFVTQKAEDVPLAVVAEASGLPGPQLEALLAAMDDENKVMCRQGVVYLL